MCNEPQRRWVQLRSLQLDLIIFIGSNVAVAGCIEKTLYQLIIVKRRE